MSSSCRQPTPGNAPTHGLPTHGLPTRGLPTRGLRLGVASALILSTLHCALPALGQTPAGCLVHSPAPLQTAVPDEPGLSSMAYQQFPTSWAGDPEPALETAWFVTFDHATSRALFVTSAWFKRGPAQPFVQVLSRTGLSELYTRYQSGTAFRDLRPQGFKLGPVTGREAGRCGIIVGRQGRAVREVVDKGILWKDDQTAVRGQMMALWGTLDAGNYNYIVRYEFHDDGTFKARMAATAKTLPIRPTMAHTHIALWRIDVDLGGAGGDSVQVLRHQESGTGGSWSDTTEAFNGGTEGALDFTVTEFTRLQVIDGNQAYDLRPIYRGLARHPATWMRNDFWATVANMGEPDFVQLAHYAANEESISGADIVLWQASPLLHVVRPEDGPGVGFQPKGAALAMWAGFDFRPRDLFGRTPFHPGTAPSDPAVVVSFGSASYQAAEGESVTVYVHLNRDAGRAMDIDLVRTHRGATEADYSGVPFNIRFDPGVTSREFTVTATGDDDEEDSEAVELGFATLPQGVTHTGATTLTILDDD